MNEKTQAILLKLIVELKKLRWKVDPNWELALKADGHVTLSKSINVQGHLADEPEWEDSIATTINLQLSSDDNITFFPEFTIYADLTLPDVASKDIAYRTDNDTAFTERDVNNEPKATEAAKKITRTVENFIEHEYDDYVQQNSEDLLHQKSLGVDPDEYDDVP